MINDYQFTMSNYFGNRANPFDCIFLSEFGCIDSHARAILLNSMEREASSSVILPFTPSSRYRAFVHRTLRNRIGTGASHECILGINFHEHLPQIMPMSVSIEQHDDVNICVIDCIR